MLNSEANGLTAFSTITEGEREPQGPRGGQRFPARRTSSSATTQARAGMGREDIREAHSLFLLQHTYIKYVRNLVHGFVVITHGLQQIIDLNALAHGSDDERGCILRSLAIQLFSPVEISSLDIKRSTAFSPKWISIAPSAARPAQPSDRAQPSSSSRCRIGSPKKNQARTRSQKPPRRLREPPGLPQDARRRASGFASLASRARTRCLEEAWSEAREPQRAHPIASISI